MELGVVRDAVSQRSGCHRDDHCRPIAAVPRCMKWSRTFVALGSRMPGLGPIEVKDGILASAWTTDWIGPEARAKLEE